MTYNNLTVNAENKRPRKSLEATAGALTRPTEAGQTSTLIMAFGRAYRKEPAHVPVPSLPSPL